MSVGRHDDRGARRKAPPGENTISLRGRRASIRGSASLLCAGALLASGCSPGPSPPVTLLAEEVSPVADQPYKTVARLPAGASVIRVQQRGVDVTLTVSGHGHSVTVDSPLTRRGNEWVLVDAPVAGDYEITLRTDDALTGSVALSVAALAGETRADKNRLAALTAMTTAGNHYFKGGASGTQAAVTSYEQAGRYRTALASEAKFAATLIAFRDQDNWELARSLGQPMVRKGMTDGEFGPGILNLWAQILLEEENDKALRQAQKLLDEAETKYRDRNDVIGQADVINSRGYSFFQQGTLAAARDEFLRAATLLESIDHPDAIRAYSNTGKIDEKRGELIRAVDSYRKALALAPPEGNAIVMENYAGVLAMLGEADEALLMFQRVRELAARDGDAPTQARALAGIGELYFRLGDFQRAIEQLRLAVAAQTDSGEIRPRVEAMILLGNALREAGQPQAALPVHRAALDLTGRATERAIAHIEIGRDHDRAGATDAAVAQFAQALQLGQSLEEPAIVASALQARGRARAAADPSAALADLAAALARHREVDALEGQVQTLTELARVEQTLGRRLSALKHAREAMQLTERLRQRIGNRRLRYSFSGIQHPSFALQVELLMQLHAEEPSDGHAERAFLTAERSRARTLGEILAESGATLQDPGTAELRRQYRQLQQQLAEAVYRKSLTSQPDQADAIERQISDWSVQLDVVTTRLGTRTARAPEHLDAFSLTALQTMLDDDTMLVEYAITDNRVFAWAVTATSMNSFDLGPRDKIETLARTVYAQLRSPARHDAQLLQNVESVLLRPIDTPAPPKRLVIVGDGALHYVPFGALPGLQQLTELIVLPSASMLAALRAQAESRKPPSRTAAIIADPVFDLRDERLAHLPNGHRITHERRLQRLPYSAREANAIAALVGDASQVLSLTGFAASREQVLAAPLDQYRYLHLATHGLVDAQRPALSGIALAAYDQTARPQPNMLLLGDIYQLGLNAELVTLSACDTALGTDIRGEGLVGMVDAFLRAGANGVIASLWPAADRATAELMTHFYDAILKRGQPPAAALRHAQRQLAASTDWAAPFYWAGFVYLGDWRRPAESADLLATVIH